MIRREIELEGERLWLLISQVEHARISGELTRQLAHPPPREVVEAITHHDDGWGEWEAAPELNPEIGGTYSFIEMPLTEALVIWDGSIEAARKVGPLAGFMVAGHFYNLLSNSEHAGQSAAVAWLAAKRKARTVWLDEWLRANPKHTLDEAKRAQHQLLVADLFGLWLCCDAPLAGEVATGREDSPIKERAATLMSEYQFSVIGFGRRHATPENMTEALAWVIAIEPYPFSPSPLSLSLLSECVPVAQYESWPALKAASRPMELRWRLMPPVSASN
jgi:hypothetical protein